MSGSTLDELLNAPESQIRSVLRALCSDRTVQRHALEHFDALKSEEGSSGGQKRKAAGELLLRSKKGTGDEPSDSEGWGDDDDEDDEDEY
ncbi:hypothetical protein CEP53_005513 [Fusarium sp. AF-6]|nr:hypothetical protein CEP53_005513 [Fusarium sp. AF-6]